jgi:hypothetical protein
MLSDEAMYERMANGWRGGLHEGTRCGASSMLKHTEKVRRWLPDVVRRYGIETVNDAGAGDMHWIQHVAWAVQYRAFDLIPRRADVAKLDITTETMPPADAVLCRAVLNHLGRERTVMALTRFRECARYLIATQFPDPPPNKPEFQRLDLREFLGEPLEQCGDGHEPNWKLALWKF